ncbi:hypothetical protein LCGC14_0507310 [marine sediment metagenome]|uniref:Uncharacterized protein n=1 Tax=marine sediment metagenome TaxID=412755 RepID=A0A0F9VAP4_9ZZZZ
MIKALLRRFGAEIVFAALVILGLIILNAVFTGKSLLPDPKPESTVTPNPLQHGGFAGEATVAPEFDCGRDFMLPNKHEDMMALVLLEVPPDNWPAEALTRDFAGTAFRYMHGDGMKFEVGFWNSTHEWVEIVVIIGIYELCADGSIEIRIDDMMTLERPRQ